MSPANRAGIGTKRPANFSGPVVVASSGPNPSATLHEDRSRLRRDRTMIGLPACSVKNFVLVAPPALIATGSGISNIYVIHSKHKLDYSSNFAYSGFVPRANGKYHAGTDAKTIRNTGRA